MDAVMSHPAGGRMRASLSAGLVTVLVGSGLVLAPSAATAESSVVTSPVTFRSNGTFTVPPGVSSITIVMGGGAGADGFAATAYAPEGHEAVAGQGGAGARLSGTFGVTSGDVLSIYVGAGGSGRVGGSGFTDGGDGGLPTFEWNAAGGGGGGSTAVETADAILAVAAGGGGGGGAYVQDWDSPQQECWQQYLNSVGGDGGAGDSTGGPGTAELLSNGTCQVSPVTVSQLDGERLALNGDGEDSPSDIATGGGGGAGWPTSDPDRGRAGGSYFIGAGGHGGESLVPEGWQNTASIELSGFVTISFTASYDTELSASVRSHSLNGEPVIFDGDDVVIDANVANLTGGPAPIGAVEARYSADEEEPFASVALVEGTAVIRVDAPEMGGSTLDVVLKYVPSGPEFRTTDDLYFTGDRAIHVSARPVFMVAAALPATEVVVSDPVTAAFVVTGLSCAALSIQTTSEADDSYANLASLRASYAGIECDESITNDSASYESVVGLLTWELDAGDTDGAVTVSGPSAVITQNIGLIDAGAYDIDAVFTADSVRYASAAADASVTVSAIETATSIESISPDPSTFGQNVGVSVLVTNESGITEPVPFGFGDVPEGVPAATSAPVPTGTVTIRVTDARGDVFEEADIPVDGSGRAWHVFTGLSAGEYVTQAFYTSNSDDFIDSNATNSSASVAAAPTVVSVEADHPYTSYGSHFVTLNATVAVDDFSPCGGEVITACSVDTSAVLVPEGELVLMQNIDGEFTEVARTTADENGAASFPLGYADAGYYSWKVVFEPEQFERVLLNGLAPIETLSNFETSEGYAWTEVMPAATVVTIDSGEGDIVYGDRREVTVSVEWNGMLLPSALTQALGAATADEPVFAAEPNLTVDGVIEFFVDGVSFGVATVENGVASASLPLLNVSQRELQVEYRGVEQWSVGSVGSDVTTAVPAPMPEGNFLISTAVESITVVPAQTSIVAVVDDGGLFGEDIAVAITVQNASGTDPVPNGTVTIAGETLELDETGAATVTLDGEWLGTEEFVASYTPGERGEEEGFILLDAAEPNFASSSVTLQAEVLSPEGEVAAGIRQVGDQVTAFGSGFTPNGDVQMTLFSDPVDLGIAQADANGDIEFTFSIPAGTPNGMHTLVMTDLQSGAEVRLPIMVAAGLVVTGVDSASVGALGTLATLLMIVGAAFIARRRREVISLG